jgi:sugar phosphate permease
MAYPSDDANRPKKQEHTLATDDDSGYLSDGNTTSQWQRSSEKKAIRKVDTTVLPLLLLGLLVFQLDRMNLASALTRGLRQDIAIDQSTVNVGNQMMYLGTVVLEIPYNLILQRLGPQKWIAAQVLVFGLIATLQVFVRDRTGFLVVRSLLGLAEAGYIPGSIYTLSTWYRKRELGTRVAIFFFGMFRSNALSPILASGFLHLDGAQGLTGWQWIFIIEGVFTMVVGTLLLFVLPGSPDEPRPLLTKGLVTFNKQDQYILRERLVEDDAEKRIGAQSMAIPWKLVRQTVLHYKRWPTLLSSFCVFSTWSPLTTYTPSIYVDLGFNRIAANALAAVGATLALVVVFCFARLSDRTNRRGYCVMLAQVCYLITLIVARSVFSMNSSTSTTALSPNRILTLLRPIVSLVATSFALNFRIMVSRSVRHFLHLRKRCATVCSLRLHHQQRASVTFPILIK